MQIRLPTPLRCVIRRERRGSGWIYSRNLPWLVPMAIVAALLLHWWALTLIPAALLIGVIFRYSRRRNL